MDIFNLDNKVAIVTGGYGHLGTAMTKALLDFGARVIVCGRSIDKFNLKFAAHTSKKLSFQKLDVTKREEVEKVFSAIISEFGSLDILINNAHAAKGSQTQGLSDDDWAFTLDGVLGSVQKCIQAASPQMQKQKSGKIINVASMYGVVSPNFEIYQGECEKFTNPAHYGAAKAGVIQLTKYYAVALGSGNIQVNSISPGPFPKDQIQQESPEFIRRLKQKNPLRKIGRPEDLAGITVLLSSKASDFITGQNIMVDGGWTTW